MNTVKASFVLIYKTFHVVIYVRFVSTRLYTQQKLVFGDVAAIHLQRVTHSRYRRRVKTSRHIQFDLTRWLRHKSGHKRMYKLCAGLEHKGKLPDGGHWVSYVLSATGEWLVKDDDKTPRIIGVLKLLGVMASILIYRVDGQTDVPTMFAGCNLGELPVRPPPPDDNESSDPSGDGGGFMSDEPIDVDTSSASSSVSGPTPRAATLESLSSGDDFTSGDTVRTASLSYLAVYGVHSRLAGAHS